MITSSRSQCAHRAKSAAEHLHEAVANAYGDARHRFEVLRDALRDEEGGVDKVIRALDHLRRKFPRTPAIERELEYFRKHRRRMRYSALIAQGLPNGSGVVEAACQTLVSQRLKLTGMRWSNAGTQAVLMARGWDQSERFDEAWALLAATYQTDVYLLSNVVPIRPPSRQTRERHDQSRTLSSRLVSSRLVSSRLVSSRLVSSRLVSSRLVSSRLVSSRLVSSRLVSSRLVSSRLVSSRLVSSRLVSSRLVSSRLVSSRLVSSRLVSSRLVSSRLVSSRLVSSRLVSSRLVSSRLVSSRLVSSRLVSSPKLKI